MLIKFEPQDEILLNINKLKSYLKEIKNIEVDLLTMWLSPCYDGVKNAVTYNFKSKQEVYEIYPRIWPDMGDLVFKDIEELKRLLTDIFKQLVFAFESKYNKPPQYLKMLYSHGSKLSWNNKIVYYYRCGFGVFDLF